MYTHSHVHTYSCAHDLHTCTHIRVMYVPALYILSPLCTLIQVHTFMNTYIYVYIHISMCTRTCSHMHMYMHTCSHGWGTQYFRSPFTEAVDMVLTSPCWLSCFRQRFLMSL